jgi:hypothetical protein
MTKLRPLSIVALAGALLLPASAALAQDEAAASAAPEPSLATEDSRLDELERLIPSALAGLPLDENLQLATGEQLMSVMRPEEIALLDELFTSTGRTSADYAAAATALEVAGDQIVYIQAHRIADVEAAETIDAWVAILSLHVAEPLVGEDSIGGRMVTLMSDGANPGAPRLHMFPARDVVWMMWTDDEILVGATMDAVEAAGGEAPAG